jgi:DNA repair protein RadC
MKALLFKCFPDRPHINLHSTLRNHPSGDCTPSEADIRITRRIAEAARLLQIYFLDHVIVGHPMVDRQAYFRFKEAGLL